MCTSSNYAFAAGSEVLYGETTYIVYLGILNNTQVQGNWYSAATDLSSTGYHCSSGEFLATITGNTAVVTRSVDTNLCGNIPDTSYTVTWGGPLCSSISPGAFLPGNCSLTGSVDAQQQQAFLVFCHSGDYFGVSFEVNKTSGFTAATGSGTGNYTVDPTTGVSVWRSLENATVNIPFPFQYLSKNIYISISATQVLNIGMDLQGNILAANYSISNHGLTCLQYITEPYSRHVLIGNCKFYFSESGLCCSSRTVCYPSHIIQVYEPLTIANVNFTNFEIKVAETLYVSNATLNTFVSNFFKTFNLLLLFSEHVFQKYRNLNAGFVFRSISSPSNIELC